MNSCFFLYKGVNLAEQVNKIHTIHTITVKAVDNTGWETLSTTKVYIDTTPPEIPDNFRAISASDKAHLKWERTDKEDVVEYRIYRQPVWSEGEYITLGIEDPLLGLEDEYHYIDNEPATGEEYTYWLEAIDHAGNIGETTESSTIKIGITEKPVVPDTEEEIKVSGCRDKSLGRSYPARRNHRDNLSG